MAFLLGDLVAAAWVSQWPIIDDALQWAIIDISQLMLAFAEHFARLQFGAQSVFFLVARLGHVSAVSRFTVPYLV